MIIPTVKITRPIALSEYAPELGDAVVYAWVNPPRDKLAAFLKLFAELKTEKPVKKKASTNQARIGKAFIDFFSELWSQHPDPDTHWPVEHVEKLISNESYPGLYTFLNARTLTLINEFQSEGKKKSTA